MKRTGWLLLWVSLFAPGFVFAQIDPVQRDLIQIGYNQAVEGHAPFAGYAFYYHNQPDFLRTNLTLRLAVAPVYLDSELGFVHGLGPNTDFDLGLAGGGFGDNYYEIHGGTYYPGESFDGHSAEISASIYHLFNPASEIPLNFILRGTAHYSVFARNDDTASNFQLPSDRGDFGVRAGLRWGGIVGLFSERIRIFSRDAEKAAVCRGLDGERSSQRLGYVDLGSLLDIGLGAGGNLNRFNFA